MFAYVEMASFEIVKVFCDELATPVVSTPSTARSKENGLIPETAISPFSSNPAPP